jgi:hypothetical protein
MPEEQKRFSTVVVLIKRRWNRNKTEKLKLKLKIHAKEKKNEKKQINIFNILNFKKYD